MAHFPVVGGRVELTDAELAFDGSVRVPYAYLQSNATSSELSMLVNYPKPIASDLSLVVHQTDSSGQIINPRIGVVTYSATRSGMNQLITMELRAPISLIEGNSFISIALQDDSGSPGLISKPAIINVPPQDVANRGWFYASGDRGAAQAFSFPWSRLTMGPRFPSSPIGGDIGVFKVDNDEGVVDGIAPSFNSGYARAILTGISTQSINGAGIGRSALLKVRADELNGSFRTRVSIPNFSERNFSFLSGDRIGLFMSFFYTIEQFLEQNPDNQMKANWSQDKPLMFFSIKKANPDIVANQQKFVRTCLREGDGALLFIISAQPGYPLIQDAYVVVSDKKRAPRYSPQYEPFDSCMVEP
ncbi:MAG: hypothetical protein FJ112_10965 [Deltaproteobacteria bacterium]|nr:hypothetical protein [Deltaproteobacteria bacterium]